MWIIIFLELITFGLALITLVFSSRENPESFKESSAHLNELYGAINTVFLLTSGFFMAAAVTQFKSKNIEKSTLFIRLSMVGGFLFLCLKTIEYSDKINQGFTLGYDTFFDYYWLLTGFHVIHVLVGLILLFFIQKNLKNSKPEDVEASAAFWHMCDLIWLLLFPVLYLIL